jgi:hypothetical protein
MPHAAVGAPSGAKVCKPGWRSRRPARGGCCRPRRAGGARGRRCRRRRKAELPGADAVGAELAHIGAVGQELDDAMVVVVGDENVTAPGVDRDPLRIVEATVVGRVGARAGRTVAERPPAPRRGGDGDHVARPRAGRQDRVPRVAGRVLVQREDLDAVVVLVGDVGHRRVGRGGLGDRQAAGAGVGPQAELPGPLSGAPPRGQPAPGGRSKTCTRSFSESRTYTWPARSVARPPTTPMRPSCRASA